MGSRASFRTAIAILVVVGCAALTPIGNGGTPDFGEPLAGLTAEQVEQFEEGKDEFSEVETVPEGLGPVFNDTACANCHLDAAVGGGSPILETRFGTTGPTESSIRSRSSADRSSRSRASGRTRPATTWPSSCRPKP